MKKKFLVILLFLISALLLIPSFVYYLSTLQKKEISKKEVLSQAILLPTETKSKLPEIAEEYLLSNEGEYAIVIKNLKTGENYFYNENKKFDSASLYKLWIMAVAYQKIKDGTLKEEDTLSLPIDYLDNTLSTTTPTPTPEGFSPTPSPEEQEAKTISMTTKDAIERMITISDNYAALLVASRSGTANVVKFLKDYDFKNSNFKQPPQTSAEDIGLFFEKLYNGEIIDEDYSEKMVDVLKNQTLNDRIPKYLPENLDVVHKTGELFNSKHDAGIVYSDKGDYIIVVLTETKDVKKTVETTAKFSKAVYDYFTSS